MSKAEFLDTFAAWAATERAIRKEKKRRMPKCDVRWDAPRLKQGYWRVFGLFVCLFACLVGCLFVCLSGYVFVCLSGWLVS